MLTRLPGNKIGMTQVFDENKRVVPVTVINFSHWYVAQIKTVERDGYCAIQVVNLRKKYQNDQFSLAWLKDKKRYFAHVREIIIETPEECEKFSVGQAFNGNDIALNQGEIVDVSGYTIGRGFTGVVKRWGFAGGPKTHGSNFHRIPGSVSHMRRQGKIIKGKRLPGHCGTSKVTIKGLQVVKIDKDNGYLFIKGCVPGKVGSLLYVQKQG